VIVVGGGAGGMMASGRAAECGAGVSLLEKGDRLGRKLLITGQTRCNVTNAMNLDDFVAMFGPNGRFLYGAFSRFFRDDLLALLGRYGVETKTERGGRIFPASDDAGQVVRALAAYMAAHNVRIRMGARAAGVRVEGGRVTGVELADGFVPADSVILATGGASYPETGSSGDGYEMAERVGHTIVDLRPALVPLVVRETELAKSMQGVALRNVRLTACQCTADEIDPSRLPTFDCGRGIGGRRPLRPVIESRMGEMMLTHFGIGGPITLQMSLAIVDALERGPVSVSIDLKPALSVEQLRRRLQRDFDEHGRRTLRRILDDLLPRKMIEPYIELSGIPADKRAHTISAEERDRLLDLLKSLRFNIAHPLPMASAIVTAGGVSLKEIDPKTMESRLVKGLYFCGEVMDLDADTGGYNLQAAFSTGRLAGERAAGG
jgi:predicted flavoprotein YhiN